MNEERQLNNVKKFINNDSMSESIYLLLLNSFLKNRPEQDVHVLAASRLAIDYLRQAWAEMDRYRSSKEKEIKPVDNVGL